MIALLLGQALAAPQAEFFVGYDRSVNDPFVVRRGFPRVGAGFAPNDVVAFDFAAYYYPDFGEADWTGLTRQLINENHVSPDISKVMGRTELVARIAPLSRTWKWAQVRTGLHAGVGVVFTRDDLQALQAENDPTALQTQEQRHPTAISGLHAEVRTDYVVGLRVKYENVRYIEVVNSTTLEMKSYRFAGMEVTACFP